MALKKDGYAVRPTKNCLYDKGWGRSVDWNASHTKRGVRIAIAQKRSGNVLCVIKLRTEIGTVKVAADVHIYQDTSNLYVGQAIFRDDYLREMKSVCNNTVSNYVAPNTPHKNTPHKITINHRSQVTPESYSKIIDWILELRGQDATKKLRSKADLEPLAFKKEPIALCTDGSMRIQHFLRECECVDIVAINDKLQITQEGISQPDAKCWFLIQGREMITGVRVKIIVNSRITNFHPLVDRRTKKFTGLEVTNNVRPESGKIDYTTFSVLDQQAVRMAIEHYLYSKGIVE